MSRQPWHATLYLGYLSLLPAVGTYVTFGVFKLPIPPIIFFFVGTGAVGVMLAVSAAYTKLSDKPLPNLIRLLDTPFWIAIGQIFGGSVSGAVFQLVFSEMAGILLGIIILACVSSLPSKDQRRGTLILLGLPFIGIMVMGVMYVQAVSLAPMAVLFLLAGTAQSTVSQFLAAKEDDIQRPSESYILIGIGAFVVALIIGAVQGGYR